VERRYAKVHSWKIHYFESKLCLKIQRVKSLCYRQQVNTHVSPDVRELRFCRLCYYDRWEKRLYNVLLKLEGIIRDSIYAVSRFEIQYLQFEIRHSISAVRDTRFNICSSRTKIQYLQFEIRNSISAVRDKWLKTMEVKTEVHI
jgi:hypothetical protein